MSIDLCRLATRLSEIITSRSTGKEVLDWLWPALLRALARGRPVTVDDLAHATGRSPAEVHDGLAGLSDTEYDERGRVVGHGITLRQTPHRFTVDGQALYTWCALDTLIFPTVLGRPAQIVSPTPGSGEPVRLSVDPATATIAPEPSTAMMSILVPAAGSAGVRAAFCNRVHFFATEAAAQDWLVEHPGGTLLSVDDAFELGRCLAQHMGASDHTGCC